MNPSARAHMATCLAACATIAASTAPAQDVAGRAATAVYAAERVTLRDVLRLVEERSPRLAAERTAVDVSAAERITARALPNPTISAGRFRPSGGANTLFDGSRQDQVTVELPLLVSGQRGARVEAAERRVGAARARVAVSGNELAVRAGETFIEFQAMQEKVSLLQDALTELQRISKLVGARLETGFASRYDVARVDVETAGVAARLEDARTESADRAGTLAALTGMPGWRPVAMGTVATRGLPTEIGAWREQLAAGNPQMVAARREEDVALAAVEVARRERYPVPSVSVGQSWTSSPYGAATFLGLSVEVPILDDKRGPVAKAEAELQAAQLRREALTSEFEADLQRLLEIMTKRQATLTRFQAEVGARVPGLRQMSEDAYRLGKGTLLELIDAARSRLDLQLTELDMRAAAAAAEFRVLALTGRLKEIN